MATETITKKVNPKIDFMPHWKKQDQCFDEEEIEMVDNRTGRRLIKNGKPVVKTEEEEEERPEPLSRPWTREKARKAAAKVRAERSQVDYVSF